MKKLFANVYWLGKFPCIGIKVATKRKAIMLNIIAYTATVILIAGIIIIANK